MIIFVILLIISAMGYGFINFLIKALNPNAEKYNRGWASFFFAVLTFLVFGFFYMVTGVL